MSNIRDLNRKINSLQNMQKVTRAMNMIASIKLRKIYSKQSAIMMFSRKTDEMISALLASLEGSTHPAVKGYDSVKKAHIIIFTADKGLCGTHNSSVLKSLDGFIRELSGRNVKAEITSIGNKGTAHCRRKDYKLYKAAVIAEKSFTMKDLSVIAEESFGRFISGEVQEVYIIGNIFYSALQQETETLRAMPPEIPTAEEEKGDDSQAHILTAAGGTDLEPSGDSLAEEASFLYLKYKLRSYYMHSQLSEHSSRMTAMENATSNSEDLINKYIAIQNHARQATITNELIEIVSGKEALKE